MNFILLVFIVVTNIGHAVILQWLFPTRDTGSCVLRSSLLSETPRKLYAVRSKIFRPDIQKPRQMENAVRDI